ncbi:hypothetical protein DFP72DRAFT_1058269 [Ephemerocybe angulata]|uniref:Uncharacterized protein n=1 Tax=Ephemerocybe angulata TaxID=980116 RepID=A0A8H6MEK3_9AGAR|nr:hypothetical protein DFP72DRAFT_1058269 [Tulosesus angulatus]
MASRDATGSELDERPVNPSPRSKRDHSCSPPRENRPPPYNPTTPHRRRRADSWNYYMNQLNGHPHAAGTSQPPPPADDVEVDSDSESEVEAAITHSGGDGATLVKAIILVNPIPEGGIPAPTLRYDITLSHCLPEDVKRLMATRKSARMLLLYLIGDQPGNDAILCKETMVKFGEEVLEIVDAPFESVGLAEGLYSKRGDEHARPGRLYVWSELEKEEYERATTRPVFSTRIGSVGVVPLPFPTTTFVCMLSGPEFTPENGPRTAAKLSTEIATLLRTNAAVKQEIKKGNPILPPGCKSIHDVYEAIFRSVKVVGRPRRGGGRVGQYALHMDTPTKDYDAYLLFIAAVRASTFKTSSGLAYCNQVTHCTICLGVDHTHPYCDWPNLPGWCPQVNLRVQKKTKPGMGSKGKGPFKGKSSYGGSRGA